MWVFAKPRDAEFFMRDEVRLTGGAIMGGGFIGGEDVACHLTKKGPCGLRVREGTRLSSGFSMPPPPTLSARLANKV
jgi:hypothetical protein